MHRTGQQERIKINLNQRATETHIWVQAHTPTAETDTI